LQSGLKLTDGMRQTEVIMQISCAAIIYIIPSGYHLVTCSDAHFWQNYSWGTLRT